MDKKQVTIYTDGGAIGNPGPGGWGAVLMYGGHRKELSGGFRKTTNNRMELLACIKALEALKYPCRVTLHSDSLYVVNGMGKGWAKRWRAKGWMRTDKDPAENADLWNRMLNLAEKHDLTFVWVRGHAGNRENERCDALVRAVSGRSGQPADSPYEKGQTRIPNPDAPLA